jgi:hypothetical protein
MPTKRIAKRAVPMIATRPSLKAVRLVLSGAGRKTPMICCRSH